MARTRSGEFFFTGVFVNYRSFGSNRQMSWNIFHQHFLLAAEAAADTRLDDTNSFDWQIQYRREHSPYMERDLCGGTNDQTIVFIPISHADMGLDVCLLNFRH